MVDSDNIKPTIVYVVGYGRSGSTLVDTILNNHEAIFGAGELSFLFRQVAENSNCSCGKRYQDCNFWSQVLGKVYTAFPDMNANDAAYLTRSTEKLHFPFRHPVSYEKLWQITLQSIIEVSDKRIIVDSSKTSRETFNRVLLLMQSSSFNIKIIHLVRDPRAVMWSINRGSNRRLEAGSPAKIFGGVVRGLIGWVVVNSYIERMKSEINLSDLLFLRYEDIVSDPSSQISRIENFIKIDTKDLVDLVEANADFNPGHGVAGNRMRRKGSIHLNKDEEWKTKSPIKIKLLSLLTLPLLKKYGYKRIPL